MKDTSECHISPFLITWSQICYIRQFMHLLIVFPPEIHSPKYIHSTVFFITETTLLLQIYVGFYITLPTTTPPPSLWHRHNECHSMQIVSNQGRVRKKKKKKELNRLFTLNGIFSAKLNTYILSATSFSTCKIHGCSKRLHPIVQIR